MRNAFINFLFPSIEVEFPSDYCVTDSVARLRAAIPPFRARLSRVAMIGKVTGNQVRLARAVPFVGNSYNPYFFGSFRETEDGVVLSGRFTIRLWVKLFMAVWFGFMTFWAVAVLHSTLDKGLPWLGPLIGSGMLAVGIIGLKINQRLRFSKDLPWLSKVITRALSASEQA